MFFFSCQWEVYNYKVVLINRFTTISTLKNLKGSFMDQRENHMAAKLILFTFLF